MKSKNGALVRGTFGALVVAALGFGATQAFAAPAGPSFSCSMNDEEFCSTTYCKAYDEDFCMQGCREAWGTWGYCDYWYDMKTCTCGLGGSQAGV